MLVVFLLFMPFTGALVITPEAVTLEDYGMTQEVVITFYNDQFEPIGCQPTPSYLSSYLLDYIAIDPARFLVEHDEQVNVRITTSFPRAMPPQEHRLTLEAYPGAQEAVTISFRPPGEQQVSLLLQEFRSDEAERGESVTITVDLRNAGNTVLFVTPQVFIKQQGSIVKNMTYQQPLIIHPNEVYPLTLRQDNSDLKPGEYVGIVQARYKADGGVRITEERLFSFTVIEREEASVSSRWWLVIAIIGSVGIVAGGIVWLVPAASKNRHGRKSRSVPEKKEKHITVPGPELEEAWHDVYVLRKDLAAVSEEVHSFVEESERWLRNRG